MIHDLAKSIGGDRVISLPLIQGDLDPHSYQLVKGDDEKLLGADLIFYNGLGLEHGASLAHILKSSSKATAVGDTIFQKFPEKILWTEGTVDPHIWMDVSLWMHAIDPILDVLIEKEPESAGYFRENAADLKKRMALVHEEIFTKLQEIPAEKRYLVTSHDAFNYFAKGYLASSEESLQGWEERFKAPEGLAPEGQLNPLDLQRIITHLQKHQIRVIFPESNVSPASIEKIVRAGLEKGLCIKISNAPLYGDAMKSTSDRGENYLETMRHNADIITSQLGEYTDDLGSTSYSTL